MILWWLACSTPDPALVAQREAADRSAEGEARLAAGDPAGARDAFAAARAAVDHPLLQAWEAQAWAASGELDRAVDVMAEALVRGPSMAEARYNRAIWLVRLGRVAEAGPELRRALADGGAEPLDVLEDPAFADVLREEWFAFLPRSPLVVQLDAPDPVAFLGSDLTVGLRLLGIVRDPVEVVAEQAVGPLQLVRGGEDRVGARELALSWTWRVAGAGPVVLGPFTVTAGRYQASAPAVAVQASAPPGHVAPPLPTVTLPVPSTAAGLEARGARWVGDELRIRAGARDRVSTVPPSSPGALLEVLDAGRPQWSLIVLHPAGTVERVELRAPDGELKWSGAPDGARGGAEVVAPRPGR